MSTYTVFAVDPPVPRPRRRGEGEQMIEQISKERLREMASPTWRFVGDDYRTAIRELLERREADECEHERGPRLSECAYCGPICYGGAALPSQEDFQEAYESAMRMRSMEGNFRGGWDACVRWMRARQSAKLLREQIEEHLRSLCMMPLGSRQQDAAVDVVLGLIAALKERREEPCDADAPMNLDNDGATR
jgi:hypothetical protein